MRNPVARNDYNRSATHPDRSKRPQKTVDEGLLDYYAENADNVAQCVYDNKEVKLFVDGQRMSRVKDLVTQSVYCPPLSEDDIKNRVLRMEVLFTHKPIPELEELLDELLRR